MLRRYYFLSNRDIGEIFDKVRDAFLAAKDGHDVDAVIDAILTAEERVKIGRRIMVAQLINDKATYEDLHRILKVGKVTVTTVIHQMLVNPEGFEAILRRTKKVSQEYKDKAYAKVGSSKLFLKKSVRTNFNIRDVKR